MAGKLINVRLNAQDAAKAEELQKQGVKLSDLLRRALHDEHGRRNPIRRRKHNVKAMLEAIYEKYPIHESDYPPLINTADRHVLSKSIADHLRSKQRANGATSRYKRTRRSA